MAADPRPIDTLRFADADGKVIALDQPGTLYLVDVWAIGCSPCMAEMPELERLAQFYEPGGRFRLMSVVAGGGTGAYRKWSTIIDNELESSSEAARP